MRYEIREQMLSNPDYLAYLNENPDWQRELSRRPENWKLFIENYKQERKLTFPDKIEKVSFLLKMLEMLQ